MFPNPQDALPLPPCPRIEQYKKLAKDLVRACKSGDASALTQWSKTWVDSLIRLTGVAVTPGSPVRIDQWAAQVEEFARRKLLGAERQCVLADAQFVLARCHGFENWPRFVRHVEAAALSQSSVSAFEDAADTIIMGDAPALENLLSKNLGLIRARSTREHRATLLHYCAANGVEGYRQITPKNIVEIASILLDLGAEIDATAEMYGGHCTTLGLAATSIHPEREGVQIALLQLLLDRGARVDLDNSAGNRQSLVKACLANGRGDAAQFLAWRGAALNLEEAAGSGRLDSVETFFDVDGRLKSTASEEQLLEGFLSACQFGRDRVLHFLLHRGMNLTAQGHNGQTALHRAVIGAQYHTVELLLKHGAPLETKNSYGGTPLGQALWSAYHSDSHTPWLPIIEELLAAGATVEPEMEDAITRLFRRRQKQST